MGVDGEPDDAAAVIRLTSLLRLVRRHVTAALAPTHDAPCVLRTTTVQLAAGDRVMTHTAHHRQAALRYLLSHASHECFCEGAAEVALGGRNETRPKPRLCRLLPLTMARRMTKEEHDLQHLPASSSQPNCSFPSIWAPE